MAKMTFGGNSGNKPLAETGTFPWKKEKIRAAQLVLLPERGYTAVKLMVTTAQAIIERAEREAPNGTSPGDYLMNMLYQFVKDGGEHDAHQRKLRDAGQLHPETFEPLDDSAAA